MGLADALAGDTSPLLKLWPRVGPDSHTQRTHWGKTVFICPIGIEARFAPECASSNTTESSNWRFSPIICNFLLHCQRPVAIVRTTQHSTVETLFLIAGKEERLHANEWSALVRHSGVVAQRRSAHKNGEGKAD